MQRKIRLHFIVLNLFIYLFVCLTKLWMEEHGERQAPSLLPSTHVFKYHVKIHYEEIVGDPTTR